MKRATKSPALLAAFCIIAVTAVFAATATPKQMQNSPLSTQEITVKIDAAGSKVHYTVDTTLHTVHGTFALRDGPAMHFDRLTGKAGGELAVVATSGESGNNSRDDRMHREILEAQKYPVIVFRPKQIEGTVNPKGTSNVKLHGLVLIHGVEHEVTAQVLAELTGDQWTGTAKFDVPYVQWGIKNPSNWLLKVKPTVQIEVDAVGSIAR